MGYKPLPRLHNEPNCQGFVDNNEETEDKDEYEYVIEKGCFPKDRKVLPDNFRDVSRVFYYISID